MSFVLLQQIFGILMQAVQLGIQYGPQVLADLEKAFSYATSSTTITPDQQAEVDSALDAANTALAAAISAKTGGKTDGTTG